MDDPKKDSRFLSAVTGLLAIAALVLLLSLCHYCYPELEHQVRQVLSGIETGPARQAFHLIADGLEQGASVKETIKASIEVLFGSPG